MVLVRPASVFLSMLGTGLPFRDKVYVAALGPRGVVAAAIALFAELELLANDYQGVDSFVGLGFMTIIGTVVVQGLWASPLARVLGVKSMQVLVISADDIGRELARRLMSNGMEVKLLDTDLVAVNRARSEGLDAVQGDGTSTEDLRKAGLKNAESFVAATSSDKTNLLACQIALQRFDCGHVVARVNNPDNVEAFTNLGIRVTSPVVSTAMLLDSLVRRSATLELISSQVPGQEVCEIEFNNARLAGKPLHAWDLKGDVLVALVRRSGTLFVPHGDTVIQKGDMLTLIGQCEEVEESRGLLEVS